MDSIGKLVRNPLLVLDGSGHVTHANPRARRAFGEPLGKWSDVFASREQLGTLLENASGSGEPVPGALDLRKPGNGPRRRRVSALALRRSGHEAYAVEIRSLEDDQFAALNEQVRQLNAEIAVRRKAQAELEEQLAHNRLLFRELQHRVKNHLQMVLSLVAAAGRGNADPGQVAFARSLQSKLSALVDAQRFLSSEQFAGAVRADELLPAVAETVRRLASARCTISVEADRVLLPNDTASPLALILNELLTNAIKHAGVDRPASVSLVLRRQGQEVLIEVRDNGPGLLDSLPSSASSGLGLVHGLCRQIGGKLDLRREGAFTVAAICFELGAATHVGN